METKVIADCYVDGRRVRTLWREGASAMWFETVQPGGQIIPLGTARDLDGIAPRLNVFPGEPRAWAEHAAVRWALLRMAQALYTGTEKRAPIASALLKGLKR